MAQLHKFTRPPEAPVFYPTEEEFRSPLQYIQSIKPQAEQYGICKIIPPKSFRPPFAVNKETFKFKARYQRLCDLDAFSRSRQSFACMLRRFWSDQGWPSECSPPTIGEKLIEWYDLYVAVQRERGYRVCSQNNGWEKVAKLFGISPTAFPSAPKDLKVAYEKNLLAYVDFKNQVESFVGNDHDRIRAVNKSAGCRRLAKENDQSASENSMNEATIVAPACPITPSRVSPARSQSVVSETSSSPDSKRMRARRSTSAVNYSEIICEVCKETDDFDNLKVCEKCEKTYHLRCIPANVRKEKTKLWLCPACMKDTFEKLRACHSFGFEQTHSAYSLDEFQRKANEFKRNYFGSSNVGLAAVEEEFWRLLAKPNDETVVEYGADLHRGELGSSGFPTENDRHTLRESEKEYIDHPWNLNKLPDNDLSMLKHITVQISGMKVPWMYVGMVFSAFCWHTEDHWSASINYLHMGEPKTWYGVPGASADAFETAFKELVPVLTESNPDLLHQLVTHMNPAILQAYDVPVYRTDQRAGEFVVTFPRAYHAGFNQGFNFAEAVNFCLADWIPHGRLSIQHYSQCKRELVFSHDELICCMADQAQLLHSTIARAVYKDFVKMVDLENTNREMLAGMGINLDEEPTLFEFMDDHERACHHCRTTLFLSAVQCACSAERLSCAEHVRTMCGCELKNRKILYRYTADDLQHLLNKLERRSEQPDTEPEVRPVPAALKRPVAAEPKPAPKKQKVGPRANGPVDFFGSNENSSQWNAELKALMKQASELVSPQTITRGRDADTVPLIVRKWNIVDVEGLITSLLSFPGTGREVSHIREYVKKHYALDNEIRNVCMIPLEEQDRSIVQGVYDRARSSNIELQDLPDLQAILQQIEFRDRIGSILTDPRSSMESLGTVLQSADELLVRTPYLDDLISMLTKLIDEGRNIEIEAEEIVQKKRKVTLSEAKSLVERADTYPFELKNVDAIEDGIDMVEKLMVAIERRQQSGQRLHIEEVKSVLSDHHFINFCSGSAGVVLDAYSKADEFIKKAKRLFLGNVALAPAGMKGLTLVDILCPRRPRRLGFGPKSPEDDEVDVYDSDEETSGKKREYALLDEQYDIDPIDLVHTHPLDVDLNEQYDYADLATVFEKAVRNEEGHFERLRRANVVKAAVDSDDHEASRRLRQDLRWCVCGGRQQGSMVQCDCCFDWFHVACTRIAEFTVDDAIADFNLVHELIENIQFMCDWCQRGIKPDLSKIEELYDEYKDIQRIISVPEIDLLSLLISRARKWKLKVGNFLVELPGIISKVNGLAEGNEQSAQKWISKLRATSAALLLQGNLFEVKMPEWLFLQSFVHENFQKERHRESTTRNSNRLVLPVSTHERCMIAVDTISPLFRQLNAACRPQVPKETKESVAIKASKPIQLYPKVNTPRSLPETFVKFPKLDLSMPPPLPVGPFRSSMFLIEQNRSVTKSGSPLSRVGVPARPPMLLTDAGAELKGTPLSI